MGHANGLTLGGCHVLVQADQENLPDRADRHLARTVESATGVTEETVWHASTPVASSASNGNNRPSKSKSNIHCWDCGLFWTTVAITRPRDRDRRDRDRQQPIFSSWCDVAHLQELRPARRGAGC